MNVLTLHQPWASLIALGVKTIETRSWPAPESAIGQPLAIHAAARRPKEGKYGDYQAKFNAIDDQWKLYGPGLGCGVVLPLGAIVASCKKLAASVPIIAVLPGADRLPGQKLVDICPKENHLQRHLRDELILMRGNNGIHMDAQLPYGDFTPGNWAWLPEDIKPVEERCPVCWGNPKRPSERIEGGSVSCRHCNRILTFNFMARPADPCDCDAARIERCPVCKGAGRVAPIPAKGRQRLWKWEAA